MNKCKKCGANYNVTFLQCPSCGTPNQSANQQNPSFVYFDKISLDAEEGLNEIAKVPENEVVTIVSFHVPFLLHLKNGRYEMKCKNELIPFELTRINSPSIHAQNLIGVIPPKNPEIPNDRFGRLAHSFVRIYIPKKILDDPKNSIFECPKCKAELDSNSLICPLCKVALAKSETEKPTHSIIKVVALDYFNTFLEAYRFYSHEYYVEPIKYTDIISFDCDYLIKGKRYAGHKYLVDTGCGGIKGGDPFMLDDNTHQEFCDFLKLGVEIKTEEVLLGNSKNHLFMQEYPLAIIEAVSALEIVLSHFIRTECEKAGIEEDEIEGFIRSLGVFNELKYMLKLLTKAGSQFDEEVFKDCEKVINLRNKVVHRGLLKIDCKDLKKKILMIEKMIRYTQSKYG